MLFLIEEWQEKRLGVYSDSEEKIFLPTLLLIFFNLLIFCAITLFFRNFSKLFIDLQIPILWYTQLKNTSLSSVNIRPLHNICAYRLLALNLVSYTYTKKMLICEPFHFIKSRVGKKISSIFGGYYLYCERARHRSMSLCARCYSCFFKKHPFFQRSFSQEL